MSKPKVYMPLYIGDYLADTLHLEAEEHGANLLLLMTMWRQGGSLPSDSERLRRIASVPSDHWPAVWAAIEGFFDEADGRITQKRLTRELEAARGRMKKARRAAWHRWSRKDVDAPGSA